MQQCVIPVNSRLYAGRGLDITSGGVAIAARSSTPYSGRRPLGLHDNVGAQTRIHQAAQRALVGRDWADFDLQYNRLPWF